jgi:hypothetical protein
VNTAATPPRPLHLTDQQLAAAYRQQMQDHVGTPAARLAQTRLHMLLIKSAAAKQAAASANRSASNAQAAPSSNQAEPTG